MSIASEITRLQNAKSALKTSINAKTDSSHQIDDETLEDYAGFVDSITTGGGTVEVEEKDVNFYDYDGTLVDSYSKADFLALNSLPENPTHDGLTAQGWNWSLSDAKTYVTSYDELDIGQMYITDDNATRIYIHLEDGRLSPYLGFAINGTATIDWGDNSTSSTVTGYNTTSVISTQHNYSSAGDYVISISSESSIYFKGDSTYGSKILWFNTTDYVSYPYRNAIQKINIGKAYIENHAFYNCTSLSYITIPKTISNIGDKAFYNCYSLSYITIPNTVTSMTESCFYYCYSLSHITIPNSVTTIKNSCFYYCYSLSHITIPNSVTKLESNSFRFCYSLSYIIIPNSVTTLESYVFNACKCLSSIVLYNNVTTINSQLFDGCNSLCHVILLGDITGVGSAAFRYCYGVRYYDFSSVTNVPSLASTGAFNGIANDCKIIVPDSLYSTWIAATNWSTYASNIIKESEWNA